MNATSSSDNLLDSIMLVMDQSFDPVFGEAWNRRQVADALCMPTTHAYLIGPDGHIIDPDPEANPSESAGFAMSRHAADEEELLLIATVPDRRGQGLGRELLEHFIAQAKSREINRIFLEMREGNSALNLYQAIGFKPIGRRPNYYSFSNGNKADAITFCLEI